MSFFKFITKHEKHFGFSRFILHKVFFYSHSDIFGYSSKILMIDNIPGAKEKQEGFRNLIKMFSRS